MKNTTRRSFIRNTALAGAGLSYSISAKSYSNIIGSNDRVNLAVAGLNGRGNAHLSAARNLAGKTKIAALCDVDNRVFSKVFERYGDFVDKKVSIYEDIREVLEDKNVDALTIATPDHWHAPMAIMGMQSGKHVFLEKPCCHNPAEGDLLLEVQKQTGKKLQIGNQQRSSITSNKIIGEIREGVIGKPVYAKAWYANTRGSIGVGKEAQVPDWLNWDLWQGPAPRAAFKDNYVHYNWHWFWNWGTGEINNNGLHELDICRWALGVDIPNHVTSSGGRYHYNDDWEFYDTQVASFQFDGGEMITWEGRSCNGYPFNNRGRGASIHGEEGTVLLDRAGFELYDKDSKLIREEKEKGANATASQDTMGIGGLDNLHMLNFIQAIQQDEPLNSPIEEGIKSTLLCHLGNMSQKTGQELKVDTKTGKPSNEGAMKMWSRSYQEGWEPKV
ncbi:MAG: dehydrogenase [Cyclobacteriaceae bacterium]|nr:MAG: dehydrogenase [Cyclobacteriaceae bacterium]